jgi:hypothetical protein
MYSIFELSSLTDVQVLIEFENDFVVDYHHPIDKYWQDVKMYRVDY